MIHPQFSTLWALLPRRKPSNPGMGADMEIWAWGQRNFTGSSPPPLFYSTVFRAGDEKWSPFSPAGHKRQFSSKEEEGKKQGENRLSAEQQEDASKPNGDILLCAA